MTPNSKNFIDNLIYVFNQTNSKHKVCFDSSTVYQVVYNKHTHITKQSIRIGKKRRLIHVPSRDLKNVQKIFKHYLEQKYIPNICVHGYIKGKSFITNAEKHVNNKNIFKIDVKNFYESIDKELITNALLKSPFDLSNEIIDLICKSTCYQNNISKHVLMQGSSCSPIISNIVFSQLDSKIMEISALLNLNYTRYADDLTFSSNDSPIFNEKHKFNIFYKYIVDLLKTSNFKLSSSKTIKSNNNDRQLVTGLIVNIKKNVTKAYLNEIKMFLYYWEEYGYKKANNFYNKDYPKATTELYYFLDGKIKLVRQVKGKDDKVVIKLFKRLNLLVKNLKFEKRVRLTSE